MINKYFQDLRQRLGLPEDLAARDIILTRRSSIENPGHLLRLMIREAKDHADAELIDLLAEK